MFVMDLTYHALIIHILNFSVIRLFISLAVLHEQCRPDGTKKAYVRLAPDYDALDVANKIGII